MRRSRPRRRPRPFRSSSRSAATRSRLGLVASLNRPGGNVTGRQPLHRRAGGEATGAAARAGAASGRDRRARQSEQSECRGSVERRCRRRPHARAAAQCLATPAPNATSTAPSRPSSNSGPARSSSAPTRSSSAGSDNSSRWRRAMQCRRSTVARVCRGRRPDELRSQHCRRVSSGRRLCRAHSQGREARRPAGRAADQVRVGDQSQDRQGARPRRVRRRCSPAPTR